MTAAPTTSASPEPSTRLSLAALTGSVSPRALPGMESESVRFDDIILTPLDVARDVIAMNRPTTDLLPKQTESVAECKCSLRTQLVGDGCEVCNLELATELSGPVGRGALAIIESL